MSEGRVVSPDDAGARLDKWLAGWPSVGSREKARQALRSGKVSVDGVVVGPDDGGTVLRAGGRVEIAWTRPGTNAKATAGRVALTRANVRVVYQDDAIVVVDKPAGLLTDAADAAQARDEDTLRKRLDAYIGRPVWPAHRLDRDTTGVVVFAVTDAARAALKDQWIARTPARNYLVVVEGCFPGVLGRFADWMAWDQKSRLQRPCAPNAPDGWFAEADWEVTERFGDRATALDIALVTGRRNQIRLHAMLAGFPVVGETQYRPDRTVPTPPFARQALHARRLGLTHPTTGAPVSFEAPLPDDLARLCGKLRAGLSRRGAAE